MESLQRQHRAGRISDEEFRILRRALLGLPPEKPNDNPPLAEESDDRPADEPEQNGGAGV
jgi:hypothetical protein